MAVHKLLLLLIIIFFYYIADVSCHSISKKQELERAVADIGDWETLCEYLDVPKHVINRLHFSNKQDQRKKSECLEVYFNSGKDCWEQVVKVVADFPFENKRLAKKIADRHGIDYSNTIIKDEL